MLSVIFWELGKKTKLVEEEEEEFDVIEVEEFDQDSEVTARIWNLFNRERKYSKQVRGSVDGKRP